MTDLREAAAQIETLINLGFTEVTVATPEGTNAMYQLARAYLAEHPEDENEPVDEAFVKSLGFELSLPHHSIKWYWLRFTSVEVVFETNEVRWRYATGWWLPPNPTRGDLRRLLGAITTKENK